MCDLLFITSTVKKKQNSLAPSPSPFLLWSSLPLSPYLLCPSFLSSSPPPQHCFFSPTHILWWAFKLVKFMLENPTNTARHTQSQRAFAFEFPLKNEMERKLLSEFRQEENIRGEFRCKKKKRASTKQEIERIYIEMHISNLPCKSGFCATPPSVSLRAGFLSSLVAIITWLCSCPGVNRCIRVCTKVYTNVYYRYAHMQAILSLYSKM